MLTADAIRPQGLAIQGYWRGKLRATLIMHSDDGEIMNVPASVYFREYEEWPLLERTAIDLCRGRILDLGAGAGCHSLHLQKLGQAVTAIDISPECVEVLQARGVQDARLIDVNDLEAEPFDTILMMMNGIGFVETLQGLEAFLTDIHRLVKPDGQILLDSTDARVELDLMDRINLHQEYEPGEYFGELEMWLEYEDFHGPMFGWLYVDTALLKDYARRCGWNCRILVQEEDGAYLAQLTRR